MDKFLTALGARIFPAKSAQIGGAELITLFSTLPDTLLESYRSEELYGHRAERLI